MKLIGVTGKTGAGKTTFSNMLAENEGVGVIHIDNILRQIKLKYFKFLMNKSKDGEKTKVNSRLKRFLYTNQFVFDLFMRFRAKLLERPLRAEIERLKQEGNETIIIDDIFIKYQKVYKDLSKIFLISRPYVDRHDSVQLRDNLTKEEIVIADIAHYKGNYREISKGNNVYKVTNNGTQEELRAKVSEIYIQHFMPFKNKYKENIEKQPARTEQRANKQKLDAKKHNEERD